MPYVKQEDRAKLEPVLQNLKELMKYEESDVGILTYVIYSLIQTWLYCQGPTGFDRYAQAMGSLDSAKFELMRKELAFYEDQKLEKNGDVWP